MWNYQNYASVWTQVPHVLESIVKEQANASATPQEAR